MSEMHGETTLPGVTELPSPTEGELETRLFDTLFQTIKDWDIALPIKVTEFLGIDNADSREVEHEGYASGNGTHVKLLLDAIAAATADSNLVRTVLELIEDAGGNPDEFPNNNLIMLVRIFALGGHSGDSAQWTLAAFNGVFERYEQESQAKAAEMLASGADSPS